jgi:hypothetical protein
MSFKKNRGQDSNLLSKRDMGQVLKDSHNMDEFALDVMAANSLVPKRYSKITWELQDFPDGTQDVKYLLFWGFGEYASNQIEIPSDPMGVPEKTTVSFSGKTASDLAGKYFFIYDDFGSVCIWFNLDGVDTQPVVVASRFLEIPINTGDSPTNLALASKTVIHADSQFIATNVTSYILIASVTDGNKSNSVDGNSGLNITTTDGHTTINSKYINLIDGMGNNYYVWWNVNGTGVNPSIPSSIEIVVNLDAVETPSTIAAKTKIAILATTDVFLASNEDEFLVVTNVHEGLTDGLIDGNTGFVIDVIQKGEAKPLVQKIEVKYDDDYIPISFEAVNI